MVRTLILAFLVACGGGGSKQPTTPATSDKILVLTNDKGVALDGMDPVTYSTDSPAEGVAEQTSAHGGATFQFATAENKAAFDADQKKYAPAFGGYCAFAASQNRLSPSDPTVYMNFEGQLLMFTNADFLEQFKKDPAGNKKAADKNWPGLVAKHGKPKS